MASGNWTDFFEGLTNFLKQILSSSPVIHEHIDNKIGKSEKVFDIVKKSKGRWYHDEDSVHIRHLKTDTAVKWGRTSYYRSWEHKNIALKDTINYEDIEIIDKVKH